MRLRNHNRMIRINGDHSDSCGKLTNEIARLHPSVLSRLEEHRYWPPTVEQSAMTQMRTGHSVSWTENTAFHWICFCS